MFTKAVAVCSHQSARLVEGQPSLATFGNEMCAHEVWRFRGVHRKNSSHVECLRLLRRDVGDLRPLALLLLTRRLSALCV